MSQLSLFLHIIIVVWVLDLAGQRTVVWLRKAELPRWMSIGTLFLTMAVLLCLFWMFCGYLVAQLTGI